MKIPKWILLSMLVCVVCTNQALSQVPQVACGVAAYQHNTTTLAAVAHEGDVLDYVVQVTNGPYPIDNGVVTLTLPDLTVVPLDSNLSLPAGGSAQYPVAFPPVPASQQYTIDSNDIGNNSAPAGSVKALSSCVADANLGGGATVQVTGTGQWPTAVKTPCVEVTKTVEPTVSKVGDEVLYTIEIHNCGNVILDVNDINDTILGPLSDVTCDELAVDETCTIEDINYIIQPNDPDPLENIVTVVYNDRIGGPNAYAEVNDSDNALVDLLDPNLEVIKECPPFSKPGDTIANTITITNTSNDANLIILSVVDTLVGDLNDCDGLLETGEQCVIDYNYIVTANDPNTLTNEVNVIAQVQGLPNILNEIAMCQVELVHPDFTVVKECLTHPVTDDTAQFRITLTNTGDVDLIITSDEPELAGPLDLVFGQQIIVDVNRSVPNDVNLVSNTINVTATLPARYELDNELFRSSSASCSVEIPDVNGCTPGFWKNHTDCWACYNPTDKLWTVFEEVNDPNYGSLADKTLLQALYFKGGKTVKAKARILLRQAVAALLNACDPNFDYPLTVAGVIEKVNDALATLNKREILSTKRELAGYNQIGCGINAHCNQI